MSKSNYSFSKYMMELEESVSEIHPLAICTTCGCPVKAFDRICDICYQEDYDSNRIAPKITNINDIYYNHKL